MDVITLEATSRGTGKQAARAVRRSGNVPCVLYGHNVEPLSFQVPALSLKPLIYTDETHTVEVQLDGQTFNCIVKQVTFDPVTDRPSHVDFQVLQEGETLTLAVPVRFIGTPTGQVNQGGDTTYLVHELVVSCLPKDIPAHIDVDVTHLSIGDSLHVSDLNVPGVEIQESLTTTLVTVLAPRVETVAPEETGGAVGGAAEPDEEA